MAREPSAAARCRAAMEARRAAGRSTARPAARRCQRLSPSRIRRRYSSAFFPVGNRPRPRHFSKGSLADFFQATSRPFSPSISRVVPGPSPVARTTRAAGAIDCLLLPPQSWRQNNRIGGFDKLHSRIPCLKCGTSATVSCHCAACVIRWNFRWNSCSGDMTVEQILADNPDLEPDDLSPHVLMARGLGDRVLKVPACFLGHRFH